jgi:hypothetical protein
MYLLNRADFGGYQQGAAGPCPDGSGNSGDDVASTFELADTTFGFSATPALWAGEGGLIYVPHPSFGSTGNFVAYRVTSVGGTPTLSVAGQSNDELYGFVSSSAIITSSGTTSRSGLVWLVRLPSNNGIGAELRAYDANPAGGVLTLRGRWPVGQGTKSTPRACATDASSRRPGRVRPRLRRAAPGRRRSLRRHLRGLRPPIRLRTGVSATGQPTGSVSALNRWRPTSARASKS